MTLVVILCSLIAASSNYAAAAERHHVRHASRHSVAVDDQRRNPYSEQPRDSNVSGTCGLFPGPCQ
jgi:hypothetical protein